MNNKTPRDPRKTKPEDQGNDSQHYHRDTSEIIGRLLDRGALMDVAASDDRLSPGAGVALQARAIPIEEGGTRKHR
jgi:hypothetical protein